MVDGKFPIVTVTGEGWAAALERSGFWRLFAHGADAPAQVLILIDLAGARPGDPRLCSPHAVEALIDLIHKRTGATVTLGSSSDESQLWAGNRDIYALAELLGYRFVTDEGLDYDIVDLGEEVRDAGFPDASVLRGGKLAGAWLDADVRLNLARLRPDPAEAFAGALANLLTCLPLPDKALHYRLRRDPGEVVAALLDRCPPHQTLIDATGAADALANGTAIAGGSALLADYAAALKAGLDPASSPLVEAVARERPLTADLRIEGDMKPIELVAAPQPLSRLTERARRTSELGERLVGGWMKGFDPAMFPPARALDARAGEWVRELVGEGSSPAGKAITAAANLLLGAAGRSLETWRTLFAKDALVRRLVPLGFDPDDYAPEEFAAAAAQLEALLPLAASAPRRGRALRWRKFEHGVLFEYRRRSAIPFEVFVDKVDVARVISFMNDYLGGSLVVVERDGEGRPIRQAERNLYLPQPNYVALYGGKPIDVSKIETVRYEPDAHRLYWTTIHSTNGSATADDGVAFFERDSAGTRVTIAGKQRFTLPPALRLFDPALLPELEAALVTDAYQNFFDRTYANFEALVEERDIHMGRAPEEETAHPSIMLEERLAQLAEKAGPYLERLQPPARPRPQPDARGFVHVQPERDERGFVHVVPQR